MKNKRFFYSLVKLATVIFALLLSTVAYAKEASFSNEEYDINVYYNELAAPGDAVFVRLKFTQGSKKTKVEKSRFEATTASLELWYGEKRVRRSVFYILEQDSNKNTQTMLTGIPLSSWWNPDPIWKLTIKYKLYGEKNLEFDLPFNITTKEFDKDYIPLDDRNTKISTNTSPERVSQSEKLTRVLETINPQNIYQTTAFTPPTPATRRTSTFASRRIYKYTSGKEVTGLHYGTDYGIPTGSEVRACADGRVVMAEMRISTGWTVVIEHLPGLYSLYYHQNELKVKEGDMVKAGDLIGLSGMTGLATGPHLHWEMRLNLEAVNPDFFTKDFTFASVENK